MKQNEKTLLIRKQTNITPKLDIKMLHKLANELYKINIKREQIFKELLTFDNKIEWDGDYVRIPFIKNSADYPNHINLKVKECNSLIESMRKLEVRLFKILKINYKKYWECGWWEGKGSNYYFYHSDDKKESE